MVRLHRVAQLNVRINLRIISAALTHTFDDLPRLKISENLKDGPFGNADDGREVTHAGRGIALECQQHVSTVR